MVDQYVHLGKIGSGSYGKVVRYIGCANNCFISPDRCLFFFLLLPKVLYRNVKDGKLYAVKVLLSATLSCR